MHKPKIAINWEIISYALPFYHTYFNDIYMIAIDFYKVLSQFTNNDSKFSSQIILTRKMVKTAIGSYNKWLLKNVLTWNNLALKSRRKFWAATLDHFGTFSKGNITVPFNKYLKIEMLLQKNFKFIVRGPSEPANAQNLSRAAAAFLYTNVHWARVGIYTQWLKGVKQLL